MQIQTGVIAFRSPTGEFIDDEPIFEDDTEVTIGSSPLDSFVKYLVNKINTDGMCKNV